VEVVHKKLPHRKLPHRKLPQLQQKGNLFIAEAVV
jgi:hypothetical protein